MSAFMQAASSLTDSILLRTLGLIAALVIAISGVVLGLRQLMRWADAGVERHVQAALSEPFDDWLFESSEFVNTPIFDATAAHVAAQAAVDLDREWLELNGGWSA